MVYGGQNRVIDRFVPIGGRLANQLLAFIISMLLLVGLLAALGYDPQLVVGALWDGSIGSSYGISISIGEAMPIMLTATGVWLSYQAGLFNIGGDGQLQVGGLAALIAIVLLPTSVRGGLAIALALLA